MTRALALSLSLALALSACQRGVTVHTLPAIDGRIVASSEAWSQYDANDQVLIRSGQIRVGLDELAAYLAFGEPAFYWQSRIGETWCRVLAYGVASPSNIDRALYSCDGVIRQITSLTPALPCSRIVTAGRRAVEMADHFDRLELQKQWEILAGILRQGQSAEDIYIAFGRPYSSGPQNQPDGSVALTQMFLDATGEYYGTAINFVDGRVVSWQFPIGQQLTPEAQQRRTAAAQVAQAQAAEAANAEESASRQRSEIMEGLQLVATVAAVAAPILARQQQSEEEAAPQRTTQSTSTRSSNYTTSRNGDSGGGRESQGSNAGWRERQECRNTCNDGRYQRLEQDRCGMPSTACRSNCPHNENGEHDSRCIARCDATSSSCVEQVRAQLEACEAGC